MTSSARTLNGPLGRTHVRTIPIAFAVGLLDGSGYLLYLIGMPETLWHGGALLLKMSALIALRKSSVGAPKEFFFLFAPLVVAVGLSSAVNIASIDLMILEKYTAVLLSIYATLRLIGRNLDDYAIAYAVTGAVCVFIYIAFVHMGKIEDSFGRYFFFNGAHFNLGCEIMVALSVATAQSLRPAYSLPLCLAYLYATSVMQGRSAMISIGIAIGICGGRMMLVSRGSQRGLLVLAFLTALGLLGFQGSIQERASSFLMMSDDYRGMGSGFSGREEYWGAALEMFEASPWLGAGIGAENEEGLQAHNFALYGLSQFGVSIVPFFVVLAILFTRCVLRGGYKGAYVLSFVPLLIFNDRFINMNAYPFYFYLLLILCGGGGRERCRDEKLSAPIWRNRMASNRTVGWSEIGAARSKATASWPQDGSRL